MIKRGAILSGQPVNYSHPLNQGLAAWWLAGPSFTGYGTPYWRDISGRYNHGTLTGASVPTWSGESFGQFNSLKFGGSGALVTTTIPASPTTLSFSVVFRATVAQAGIDSNLPCYWESTNDSCGFTWDHGNSSFQQAYYQRNSAGSYIACKIATALSAGVWYRAVGTFDGATMSIYLNGVLSQTAACSGIYTFGTATRFAHNNWQGNLTSVQWWHNRCLSAGEVARLDRETLAGYPNLLNRVRVPVYAPAAAPGGVSPFFFNTFVRNRRRTA